MFDFAPLLDLFPDDEEGRMLHSPGLRTGGRFYAFTSGDDVIVKLPAARVAELIASGAGLPCSPRPGRPMREWVRVPAQDCLPLILEARAFVTRA
ncbi:hypothetical protein ACFPIJ_39980 [Dactylosporangium cerinum]|uniref:TfoX N-terminal domain-containing protein n=1 Tax=Dactylosporangium cerinum TaxID=1434730 RepID=A0ABV9W9K0_9ACTN